MSTGVLAQSRVEDIKNKIELAQNKANERAEIEGYIQLGDYYIKQNRFWRGRHFYRKANRTNKYMKYRDLAVIYNRQFARSYVQEDNFEKAKVYYKSAISLSKKYKLSKLKKELIQEFNQLKENHSIVIQAKDKLKALQSLSNEEALNKIQNENKHDSIETEKFLQDIEKLSKEKRKQVIKLKLKESKLSKNRLKIQYLKQYNNLKELELKSKNEKLRQNELKAKRQRNIIILLVVSFIILLILIGIIIRNYNKQKGLNLLLQEKNGIIQQKNKEMIDSLNYAQRIQSAVVLGSKLGKENHPQFFMFNQPKDIVSGDFFWMNQTANHKIVWAVADCTGHGVPGAFMSIIGAQLLDEIIMKNKITDPGEILFQMRKGVIASLHQEEDEVSNHDGMDIALCVWDQKSNLLEYAGAYNSIYIKRNNIIISASQYKNKKFNFFTNDLLEIKADRQPVGHHPFLNKPFETIKVKLKKGDTIYATSDGFQDQFGGQKNKKYTIKRLKKLMIKISNEDFDDQYQYLKYELENWKGNNEQVDDICLVGVRV